MKWESTEPNRGNFTFEGADEVVAFATANGQEIHCHNFVWHSQLAPWVYESNFDNATLIQVMKDHIYALGGRYKDVCTRWDVVNEALNENGTYRSSVWYDTIGEAFLPLAFKFAAEATPKSKLYYNDYNLEYGQNKTAGAARIVELIKSYGVRIDGVGFQAHLAAEATGTVPDGPPSKDTLVGSLETMTNLGVDVAYTELDLRVNTTDADGFEASPASLEAQADAYATVVSSCMDVKRCRGITVWGISDRYSWIPGVFPGEGAALLWDADFQKKAAYNATLETILS
jgi:endo-1,4-beta-xylanase